MCDPVTAAIIIGGTLLASKSMAPGAPDAPKPPTPETPGEKAKKTQAAADKTKKQVVGAYGADDTILTGPTGLGSYGGQAPKNILSGG
jgi:hypothetical protein